MKTNSDNIDNYRKAKLSLDEAHRSVLKKIQTRRTYVMDDGSIADFSIKDKIQYAEEIVMEDLTTDEQHFLGVDIFRLKILKDVSMPKHRHRDYTQLIYVIDGAIYDDLAGVRFDAGDTLYVSKRNEHSVRYLKGADILMIFIPSLKVKQNKDD